MVSRRIAHNHAKGYWYCSRQLLNLKVTYVQTIKKIQAKKQAEQVAKGQQAGKGYVGGTGFKKGGLATRRKTKGK